MDKTEIWKGVREMTARRATGVAVPALGILLVLLASTASAEDQAPPSQPQTARESASASPAATLARPMHRDTHASAQDRIEQRVHMMTTALNLSASQQWQLRSFLMEQRSELLKIRNDPSVVPDDHVRALRAINQKTVERIRGMLDQEQRDKYSPPPSRPPPAGGDQP
jgi:hypothetical protein